MTFKNQNHEKNHEIIGVSFTSSGGGGHESFLWQTSLLGGKRVVFEANESYDFPDFSHCISSFLHPLEPRTLPAKSGSTYNHPSHVTELGQSAEKVGNVERLKSRQPLVLIDGIFLSDGLFLRVKQRAGFVPRNCFWSH